MTMTAEPKHKDLHPDGFDRPIEAGVFQVSMDRISGKVDENMVIAHRFALHDLLGVDTACPLTKVGEIAPSDMDGLDDLPIDLKDVGWPEEMEEGQDDFCHRYGVDGARAVQCSVDGADEFVRFGRWKGGAGSARLLLTDILPQISLLSVETASFSATFAHPHEDEVESCGGQVILVTSNPLGHRLIGVDDEGQHHVLVPSAGDVLLLDHRRTHAVMPNQAHAEEAVLGAPMRAVFITLEDQQRPEALARS